MNWEPSEIYLNALSSSPHPPKHTILFPLLASCLASCYGHVFFYPQRCNASLFASLSTFLLLESLDEKLMPLYKQKKKNNQSNNSSTSIGNVEKHRFLIIVNFLGSAGPIEYVVNGNDSVAAVIDTALKMYAREGRLPVLGSDVSNCLLYPANAGSDALYPYETIASCGGRNFLLCKKQTSTHPPHMTETRPEMMAKKKSSCWKAWLNISSSISKIFFPIL